MISRREFLAGAIGVAAAGTALAATKSAPREPDPGVTSFNTRTLRWETHPYPGRQEGYSAQRVFYPQTLREFSAGIRPVDCAWPDGHAYRYGISLSFMGVA